MNNFSKILEAVTVACRDNGNEFVESDRVAAIKSQLEGSDFKLQHEGKLSLVYAKHEIGEDDDIVLVTSHVDSIYSRNFCTEEGDCWKGTFDNSVTNAAVLYNMLHDQFADNVVVVFAGDGEMDGHGLDEAVNWLEQDCNCYIRFALVADVATEGWEEECPFVIRNDFHVDMFTAQRVVDTLVESFDFLFMHIAGHDEAWDLDEMELPCFTLALPVKGDLKSDEGVLVRQETMASYCCGMAAVTLLVSGTEPDMEGEEDEE